MSAVEGLRLRSIDVPNGDRCTPRVIKSSQKRFT
jgi:hypothetical protein